MKTSASGRSVNFAAGSRKVLSILRRWVDSMQMRTRARAKMRLGWQMHRRTHSLALAEDSWAESSQRFSSGIDTYVSDVQNDLAIAERRAQDYRAAEAVASAARQAAEQVMEAKDEAARKVGLAWGRLRMAMLGTAEASHPSSPYATWDASSGGFFAGASGRQSFFAVAERGRRLPGGAICSIPPVRQRTNGRGLKQGAMPRLKRKRRQQQRKGAAGSG